MIRRLLPHLLVAVAMLCFAAALVPWIASTAIIAFSTHGEQRVLLQADSPASYSLLQFDSWQEGQGNLRPSEILTLPTDVVIQRHRVGRASGWLTRFTYYEARYQMPDGTIRVTHASGPEMMIHRRREVVNGGFLLLTAIGIFHLARAVRLNRTAQAEAAAADRQHLPETEITERTPGCQ